MNLPREEVDYCPTILDHQTTQTRNKHTHTHTHTHTMENSTDYSRSRCGECLASLQGMLKRQRTVYNCSNSSSSTTNTEYLAVRRSLIDVFDEVYAVCQLQNRETVAVAVSYMDRFMVTTKTQRFVNTEIVAMTCFYVAVKLYEPTVIPPAILCELFQKLLAYDEDDEDSEDDASTTTVASVEVIESMELKLMEALQWNLNPPTAIMFVRQLLCCLPNGHLSQWKKRAESIAHKYLELGLKSEEVVPFDASTQAVAALFCAVEHALPIEHRIAVYKFLLKAVHMTGPAEQRIVLAAQGVLCKLLLDVEDKGFSPKQVIAAVDEQQTKRAAPVMTSIDRPTKKQRRVAVVELSPRSVYA